VSRLDAKAFCAWLTKKERAVGRISPKDSYRLPTAVEWSFACGDHEFPWGSSYPPGSQAGNYSGREAIVDVLSKSTDEMVKAGRQDCAARTAPVGLFAANQFGLCDMGGNVWEYCDTWFTSDLNDKEAKNVHPELKDDGGGQAYSVIRGGGWTDSNRNRMRSAYHYFEIPHGRATYLGFRCVLEKKG